jgi:inosine-uridine nucleoside N-ribohydrolase
MRVHLDTDFAGDTDDAAALAMLLGWPECEIVGITTVADPDGMRAGYVNHFLGLVGRRDIPVAAGAGASLAGAPMGDLPAHDAYWGSAVVDPAPSPNGAAVELMSASIARGATVIGVGPYTNLASLEAAHPGALARARIVLMGGWLRPPDAGFPPWGPDRDWNVQCDTTATTRVFDAAGDLTLATLPGTIGAHVRTADLERLETSGPLGRLLARQARAHAAELRLAELARTHTALPDDLLNFQWDPVACAVALGWSGATIESTRLRVIVENEVLRFAIADDGKPVDVVVAVDGPAFAETWLSAIERVDAAG